MTYLTFSVWCNICDLFFSGLYTLSTQQLSNSLVPFISKHKEFWPSNDRKQCKRITWILHITRVWRETQSFFRFQMLRCCSVAQKGSFYVLRFEVRTFLNYYWCVELRNWRILMFKKKTQPFLALLFCSCMSVCYRGDSRDCVGPRQENANDFPGIFPPSLLPLCYPHAFIKNQYHEPTIE